MRRIKTEDHELSNLESIGEREGGGGERVCVCVRVGVRVCVCYYSLIVGRCARPNWLASVSPKTMDHGFAQRL